MYDLQTSKPEVWKWLYDGNFCVKKSHVAFSKIGVDHALEQVNRSLKVLGGITGITMNADALARFFLVAPEVSRLAEESERQVGLQSTATSLKHRELSKSVVGKEETNVRKLRDVFKRDDPFEREEPTLINIITQSVIPQDVQEDILNRVTVGKQAYAKFVEERIRGNTNLWDKMTKLKLKHWKITGKSAKVMIGNEIMELKEDRSWFARMAIVARSRPEMDIATDIGQFEFSCVSRSLFAHDGSLLPCTDKGKLMHKLVSSSTETSDENAEDCSAEIQTRAIVINAMAVVQGLSTIPVKTCGQFANEFVKKSHTMMTGYGEAHVIFDHYDIHKSLKANTRNRRNKGEQERVHVCKDATPIDSSFGKFISNTKTKHKLTILLAEKLLDSCRDQTTPVVVSTSTGTKSNNLDVDHLSTSQEEAETILVLHGLDAAKRGLNVDIVSPDTDDFILALSRLPMLGKNPRIITGIGTKKQKIKLKPVYNAIGPAIADALPSFHAFTGCDTCGKFHGKDKLACWNCLLKQSRRMIDAFATLGRFRTVLEGFVCSLYRKSGLHATELAGLRWELFKTSQAESDKLPPTKAALDQHLLRAAYQSFVWSHLLSQQWNLLQRLYFNWYTATVS